MLLHAGWPRTAHLHHFRARARFVRDATHIAWESKLAAMCRLAQALFSVPLVHISTDDGEGRFESGLGLDGHDKDLASSLRAAAGSPDGTLIIEDLSKDARFAANPFVIGAPHVRFYAEAALMLATGIRAGSICLFDTSTRILTERDRSHLKDLAQILSLGLTAAASLRQASRQEALYRLLANHSTDTVVRGNLDGVRLYISPAVRTLLGYEPEELIGKRAADILHPDDAADFRKLMEDVRAGKIEQALVEHRQRHKNGSWVWIEASIRLTRDAASGTADGYVVSVRDVGRRKEAESRLTYTASHDPLTGLPNRILFDRRLAGEIARAARTGKGFALLFLDLDHFKLANDTFGHQAGDAVLRAAANRFRSLVRAEDMVARLGGDEFVVIQSIGDEPSLCPQILAQRLIDTMADSVHFAGTEISTSLSIGIALATSVNLDADDLLRAADQALYQAKNAGRNTYALFEG